MFFRPNFYLLTSTDAFEGTPMPFKSDPIGPV